MTLARYIILDATPLGLASRRRGIPVVDGCYAWLNVLGRAGARIVIPEIADYEIRRELQRLGHSPGLRRLDSLADAFSMRKSRLRSCIRQPNSGLTFAAEACQRPAISRSMPTQFWRLKPS